MRFMCLEDAVQLIKLEYAETPTLALTPWQAQRLWNLSEELCDRALQLLVSSAFLVRNPDGTYGLCDVPVASLRGSPHAQIGQAN
jgi:hypothetical protein